MSLRAYTKARALRLARTCYDHLAGHLGVAVMQSLLTSNVLVGANGEHDRLAPSGDRLAARGRDVDYWLTPEGKAGFAESFGIDTGELAVPRVA